MKGLPIYYLFLIISLLFSCQLNTTSEQVRTEIITPSLKQVYQPYFTIGAAINDNQINEIDTAANHLLSTEFSSISPENIMKSMYLHPAKDSFYFEMADKFVALGEKNKQFIVGHTLIWHSQLSEWIGKITDKKAMQTAVADHIQTIVTRYKGRINGWDVVNEALNEDGTLRESVFLKVMGENYLSEVFALAAKADPSVELYYNDYNLCRPAKRVGVVNLVKKLQADGVKIDGVGCQAHWSLTNPTLAEIENSILAYSDLGMKVMFTEMDITVIPNPWDLQGADVDQNFEGSPFMNPYPETLPDSVQTQLAQRYADIFKLFLKHEDKVSRVTFWGVNDSQSWLNNWPIKNRTQYPLLFDRQFQPKKAYHSVMNLRKENNKMKE
ncbi:MAG: endo-1,4-beta-xylanase [Saprospiraceae bacterium]